MVIDISAEDFEKVKYGRGAVSMMRKAIQRGAPLPKGHGDLVDRSEVLKSLFEYHKGKKTIGQCIEDVRTIIVAESEGEE